MIQYWLYKLHDLLNRKAAMLRRCGHLSVHRNRNIRNTQTIEYLCNVYHFLPSTIYPFEKHVPLIQWWEFCSDNKLHNSNTKLEWTYSLRLQHSQYCKIVQIDALQKAHALRQPCRICQKWFRPLILLWHWCGAHLYTDLEDKSMISLGRS